MTTLQIGRAYPIKARKLTSKKDENGKTWDFMASHFTMLDRRTVRVFGRDCDGAWAHLNFKLKDLPSWLRRGIRNAEVQWEAEVRSPKTSVLAEG